MKFSDNHTGGTMYLYEILITSEDAKGTFTDTVRIKGHDKFEALAIATAPSDVVTAEITQYLGKA